MDAPIDPTKAALDSAKRELRVCEECGEIYLPKRIDQKFDTQVCTKKWWSRVTGRSQEIYPILYAWRKSRGKVKFTDVTNTLDRWLSEDKERTAVIEESKRKLKEARS